MQNIFTLCSAHLENRTTVSCKQIKYDISDWECDHFNFCINVTSIEIPCKYWFKNQKPHKTLNMSSTSGDAREF